MSGANLFIKEDLKINDVQIQILTGTLNIYSLIGSGLAGRTSDWIGRRYTVVLSGAIFFVGSILMSVAPGYAFLMFGRFVAGIGVGYGLMISPVYTAEISPTLSRGFLTSFAEVFVNVGILLGYVSNYAFSKLRAHLAWRSMLGMGALPAIILAIGVLAVPESPRWLVMQGRLGDAKRVLNKTSTSKEEAQLRLDDIKEAAGIAKDLDDDVVPVSKKSRGEGVWKDLLLHPTPAVSHILIAALGIHFFEQASGIDSVVLYSPRIFEKAGIKSYDHMLLATVAVGFVKTIAILVATFSLDRIGRRRLLLTSVAGMVFSLVCLGVGLTIIDHQPGSVPWAIALCITMVLLNVAFFSIGLGPITWVYSSEIFPLRLRAQGVSMGVAVNRLTSGAISMSFLSLYKAITIGWAFFLYAGIGAVSWVFFYTMLPETKGRTLEDMEVLFDIGVMSGANLFIQEDLKINDVKIQILTGTLNIYSLIGSGLAGRTSDWIGRRYTVVLSGVIFFVGAILMGVAPNYAFLMFGRFVAGIGVGYGLMISPVYTAEISPTLSRGFLTSFPEVFVNVGILLGYVSNYAFSKLRPNLAWRFMLGIGALPAIILVVCVLAMPESPRWLVMQGRLGDAKRVLNKISASNPRIFQKAGIKSYDHKLLATVAVGFVKTIAILVATFFLDRFGRRRLLLTSVAGMVFSLVCLAVGLTIIDDHREKVPWAIALCITMVLLNVAFFSIGLGPITWVYSSEIFPLTLRAQGVSMGVAVNRLTSGAISMSFLSLYKAITIGGAFFLYAGIAAVSWVFFYTMLPETRGRTLEDMEVLFGKYHRWREAKVVPKQSKQGDGDENKSQVK
ncbi:hypothetical protein ACE6H2_027064 [Prunus campanulata]